MLIMHLFVFCYENCFVLEVSDCLERLVTNTVTQIVILVHLFLFRLIHSHSFVFLCAILQSMITDEEAPSSVWIAKVVKVADKVTSVGNQATLSNMELDFYLTVHSSKSKGSKLPIYGRMVRAEHTNSRKGVGKKNYVTESLDELSSLAILRVFSPGSYIVGGRVADAASRLASVHVQQAVDFAVVQERYGQWLANKESRG
jgi:hypothetical protein